MVKLFTSLKNVIEADKATAFTIFMHALIAGTYQKLL